MPPAVEHRDLTTGQSGDSQYSADFPGGPVVKTPHLQCKEPGLDPWVKFHMLFSVAKKKKQASAKCNNMDKSH